MSLDGEKIARRTLLGGVAATVVILCLPMAFAWPMVDDYLRAADGRDLGTAATVSGNYHQWSGRWAAIGLQAFLFSATDMRRSYPLWLGALAVAEAAAVFALWRILIPRTRRTAAALPAATTLALLWTARPAPEESLYWVCGGTEYRLSIVLAVLVVAGLAHWDGPAKKGGADSWTRALLLAPSAAVVAGLHELIGLLFCLVLAAGAAVTWRGRSPGRVAWGAAAAAALAGFLVVFFAPGNAYRSLYFPLAGDPARTVTLAVTQAGYEIPGWLFDARLLLATALLVLVPPWGHESGAPSDGHRSAPWPWIVPWVGLLSLAGMFLGPSWATGTTMPPRALAAAHTLFVIGYLATLRLWLPRLPNSFRPDGPLARRWAAVAALGLAAALPLTGNARLAIRELALGKVQAWRRAMAERDVVLEEARGTEGVVVVPPLAVQPFIFSANDITEDPTDWRNVYVARFYQVEALRTAPPPRERPTALPPPAVIDGGGTRPPAAAGERGNAS